MSIFWILVLTVVASYVSGHIGMRVIALVWFKLRKGGGE